VAALAAALALPAASASAHVEIKPGRTPAGAEAKLTFEVPNERPDAVTTEIAIQLPRGVTAAPGRRSGGWRVRATARTVTLTAPQSRVLRGEERGRFPLVLQLPVRPRTTLTFKVLQTYDSDEVVRWIGPPGTSEPAPRLRLTAAAAPTGQEQEEQRPAETQTTPEQPAGGGGDDGGGDDGGGVPTWAGIGLILLAAAAGTLTARARNRRRMRDHLDE
jgi:uncharacterized protein YcnI